MGALPLVGRATVKYHSFYIEYLTYPFCIRKDGHCLVGSLTGEVACERVSQAHKGILGPDGNRTGSATAYGCLTVRQTSQAGAKAGHSDPRVLCGRYRA
ncbi:MAG TPA: hypothetical protein DCW55_03925 [Candidatus Pacebacteria bacterium]|nr:hypothetical protein [Candidatus Paceibacterota bacterium]HAX01634.1 hypothetical protein [Candidatus Paceibacterota bacterium]